MSLKSGPSQRSSLPRGQIQQTHSCNSPHQRPAQQPAALNLEPPCHSLRPALLWAWSALPASPGRCPAQDNTLQTDTPPQGDAASHLGVTPKAPGTERDPEDQGGPCHHPLTRTCLLTVPLPRPSVLPTARHTVPTSYKSLLNVIRKNFRNVLSLMLSLPFFAVPKPYIPQDMGEPNERPMTPLVHSYYNAIYQLQQKIFSERKSKGFAIGPPQAFGLVLFRGKRMKQVNLA